MLNLRRAADRKGYRKVSKACTLATSDGYSFIWIDTCCIDKSSSAELSEAINSMFRWYRRAAVCYAYLTDVAGPPVEPRLILHTRSTAQGLPSCDTLSNQIHGVPRPSRWFTRGFTLQELIAPAVMRFYDADWGILGTRNGLSAIIHDLTWIDEDILDRKQWLEEVLFSKSVAKHMSWASRRMTTRPEDIAYCLLGIFGVNIPLLYGEGGKMAFFRLQEQILRQYEDQSILAWDVASPVSLQGTVESPVGIAARCGHASARYLGWLAPHPSKFYQSSDVSRSPPTGADYSLTERGLRIRMRVLLPDTYNLDGSCVFIDSSNLSGPVKCLAMPIRVLKTIMHRNSDGSNEIDSMVVSRWTCGLCEAGGRLRFIPEPEIQPFNFMHGKPQDTMLFFPRDPFHYLQLDPGNDIRAIHFTIDWNTNCISIKPAMSSQGWDSYTYSQLITKDTGPELSFWIIGSDSENHHLEGALTKTRISGGGRKLYFSLHRSKGFAIGCTDTPPCFPPESKVFRRSKSTPVFHKPDEPDIGPTFGYTEMLLGQHGGKTSILIFEASKETLKFPTLVVRIKQVDVAEIDISSEKRFGAHIRQNQDSQALRYYRAGFPDWNKIYTVPLSLRCPHYPRPGLDNVATIPTENSSSGRTP